MPEHHVDHVEVRNGRYVLVCGCGWRSPAERKAGDAGQAWDAHERQAQHA